MSQMSQTSPTLMRRPGLVTFAAVMLFIAGGFELIIGLVLLFQTSWIRHAVETAYGPFNFWTWLWAVCDVLFALALFYAAYDILRGGTFGQMLGVLVAGFSAIRWFFYLPVAPLLGATIIAIDVLVIYALVSHSEYFFERNNLQGI